MIVQVGSKIYHDEHDFEITITNDNTKQTKVTKIKLRGDIYSEDSLDLALEQAKELYKEVMGD